MYIYYFSSNFIYICVIYFMFIVEIFCFIVYLEICYFCYGILGSKVIDIWIIIYNFDNIEEN